MGVVYVKESTAIDYAGGVRMLPRGEAWDSDSDVVKKYPNVFEEEPTRVAGRPNVERATRAPGERRNTRAPRQSDDAKKAAAEKRKAAAAAKRKAAAEAKKAEAAKPADDGAADSEKG